MKEVKELLGLGKEYKIIKIETEKIKSKMNKGNYYKITLFICFPFFDGKKFSRIV